MCLYTIICCKVHLKLLICDLEIQIIAAKFTLFVGRCLKVVLMADLADASER